MSVYPLPFGLSGCVNTPQMSWPASINFCKQGTAKPGVPIKMIRIVVTLIIFVFLYTNHTSIYGNV